MLYWKEGDDPQMRFYLSHCEYCGALFIKFQNRTTYCSPECRYYSDLEHTESRVRKHRKKYKNKTDDYWGLGTGYLHGTPRNDWNDEHQTIMMERMRLKIPAK